MHVTRPDSWTARYSNFYYKNFLGSKLKSENYLRKSGLDYTIIRPGELLGNRVVMPYDK